MRNVILMSLVLAATPTLSQEPSKFDKFLADDAPKCFMLKDIEKVADQTINLTNDQFQFARALYIALPPVSRELPPGDRGWQFKSGGATMLGLGTELEVCSRFLAPDFVQNMMKQILDKEITKLGDPT